MCTCAMCLCAHVPCVSVRMCHVSLCACAMCLCVHMPCVFDSYIKSWKKVPRDFADGSSLNLMKAKGWLFKNLPVNHVHR